MPKAPSTTHKQRRTSIGERAAKFGGLAVGVGYDGLRHLIKENPEQAQYALYEIQQREQEIAQQEQAAKASLSDKNASKPADEQKTEKELALQAQLPFKNEKKLLMTMKTEAENALRARQTSTPTLGR